MFTVSEREAILEAAGIDSNQRLFIPAYEAGKEKVTSLCNALQREGVFEGVGWVEIDNAKEVTFFDPSKWTGKLACWVTYKRRRIEKRLLRTHPSAYLFDLPTDDLLRETASEPGAAS